MSVSIHFTLSGPARRSLAESAMLALHAEATSLGVREVTPLYRIDQPAAALPVWARLVPADWLCHGEAARAAYFFRWEPASSSPFTIGLARYRGHSDWRWSGFYAAGGDGVVAASVAFTRVCSLLDAASRFGIRTRVRDESGYWTRRDPLVLLRAVAASARVVGHGGAGLSSSGDVG